MKLALAFAQTQRATWCQSVRTHEALTRSLAFFFSLGGQKVFSWVARECSCGFREASVLSDYHRQAGVFADHTFQGGMGYSCTLPSSIGLGQGDVCASLTCGVSARKHCEIHT